MLTPANLTTVLVSLAAAIGMFFVPELNASTAAKVALWCNAAIQVLTTFAGCLQQNAKSAALSKAAAKVPTALASAIFVLGLAGCTAAQGAALLQGIQAADDIIMSDLPIACALAESVDPTGATVVCAILDASGNIVASTTRQLQSPAVASAVVSAHPAPVALTASIKAKASKKDGGK
jgi:hypothetical protein